MRSEASSVEAYLAALPDARRTAIEGVREVILANLPEGYVEAMNWGTICYEVPLATYPNTYNGKPLMVAALASQKNHMALYLTGIYMDAEAREQFERDYAAAGKPLRGGKSCVHFKKPEDLPLELVAKTIASMEADAFVARFQKAQDERKRPNRSRKTTPRTAPKTAPQTKK